MTDTMARGTKLIVMKSSKKKVYTTPTIIMIWIIFFGVETSIGDCILSCLWCITIYGISIGKQYFKMDKLILMPFDAAVTCSS